MTKSSAELFEKNFVLIAKVTNKFMRYGKRGIEYDDLFQEVAIGLDEASKRYDPEKSDLTFERYAVGTMCNKAKKFMMKTNVLHTSRDIVELAVTINKRKIIEQTTEEIAKALNVKQRRVELALQHLKQPAPVSAYLPISGAGDDATGLSLIDTFTDNADFYDTTKLDLKLFIDALEPQKKKVLELRLQGLSQDEIAKIVGTTQMTVSRIMKRLKVNYVEYMQIS